MIATRNSLRKLVSSPLAFVLTTTVLAGTVGLAAAALVHFVVQPLSKAQFLISILGFAVFGFLASAADSAPPAVRARLAVAFTSRPCTPRELLLWFVVIAVAVLGLLLGGSRVS